MIEAMLQPSWNLTKNATQLLFAVRTENSQARSQSLITTCGDCQVVFTGWRHTRLPQQQDTRERETICFPCVPKMYAELCPGVQAFLHLQSQNPQWCRLQFENIPINCGGGGGEFG